MSCSSTACVQRAIYVPHLFCFMSFHRHRLISLVMVLLTKYWISPLKIHKWVHVPASGSIHWGHLAWRDHPQLNLFYGGCHLFGSLWTMHIIHNIGVWLNWWNYDHNNTHVCPELFLFVRRNLMREWFSQLTWYRVHLRLLIRQWIYSPIPIPCPRAAVSSLASKWPADMEYLVALPQWSKHMHANCWCILNGINLRDSTSTSTTLTSADGSPVVSVSIHYP